MQTPDPTAPSFVLNAINLASASLGAKAISATDDFFAAVDRMLQDGPAVFIPDKYDDNGKWMDGWESRRRRGPGHDFAVVKLAVPGRILGFDVDTSHFTGNYPPAVSIEGARVQGDPDASTKWTDILQHSPMGPARIIISSVVRKKSGAMCASIFSRWRCGAAAGLWRAGV